MKLKLKFSDISIERVITEGPAINGIEIGKTAMLFMLLSSKISLDIFFFLFVLFSKTISKEIKSKNIPPMIWKEYIETPINIKNLFPNIKKNVNTENEIINTKKDNIINFFLSKLEVKTANNGIRDSGSIAINVFKRFCKKISCI